MVEFNQSCIPTRDAASSAPPHPYHGSPGVLHALHLSAAAALVVCWLWRYLLAPVPLEQLAGGADDIPAAAEEQTPGPPHIWTVLDVVQLGIATAALRGVLEQSIRSIARLPQQADPGGYFRYPSVHCLEEAVAGVRLTTELPDAAAVDATDILRQAWIPNERLLNVTGNPLILHEDPCAWATESTETVIELKIATVLVCLIWQEVKVQYQLLSQELKEGRFAMVVGQSVDKILEVARLYSNTTWCACHVKQILTLFDTLVDILCNIQRLPLNRSYEVAGILRNIVEVFSGILYGTVSDLDNSDESATHPSTVVFRQVLEFFYTNTNMVQSTLATESYTSDHCSLMFIRWVSKLEEDAETVWCGENGRQKIFLLNNAYYVWQMIRRPGESFSNVELVTRLIVMIKRYRESFFNECLLPLITPLLDRDNLKNPRRSHIDEFTQGFVSMCLCQSTWKVTPELKYELREEIKSVLVEPYKAFVSALQKNPNWHSEVAYYFKRVMRPSKIHNKFTVEQLEHNIEQLYES